MRALMLRRNCLREKEQVSLISRMEVLMINPVFILKNNNPKNYWLILLNLILQKKLEALSIKIHRSYLKLKPKQKSNNKEFKKGRNYRKADLRIKEIKDRKINNAIYIDIMMHF